MRKYVNKWAIYCRFFRRKFTIVFCKIIDYVEGSNNTITLRKVEDFMTNYGRNGFNFSEKEDLVGDNFFVFTDDVFDEKNEAQKELIKQIYGVV